MKLSPDAQLVLADLKIHRLQFSWDWEADARFAEKAGGLPAEVLEVAERLAGGHFGIAPLAMGVHRQSVYPHVTVRRLRALRGLSGAGLVVASWGGTGPGGRTSHGVGRTRHYQLKES